MNNIINSFIGLCLENVNIYLKEKALLQDLQVSVSPGEIACIMGPSGCGKSTLLSFITGTLEQESFHTTGKIYLNRQCINFIEPEKRKIGILFQDSLLFPHMNVIENLLFGIPRKYKKKIRLEKAYQALEDSGLEEFAGYEPTKLSGGQKSRIALFRTLLSEPQALLLDEPFSQLDEVTKNKIRLFTFKHIRKEAIPTILVTHDIEDSTACNGRVIDLTVQKSF